ncbi:SDR family NAD(P)-dependent oxidoreductase [Chloroflexota bacterium]
MLLSNRVAIVTGGAKGIGKGISLKFAGEGCSVVIADVLEKEAEETVNEIKTKGVDAIYIHCDHTSNSQVNDMVKQSISKFGKVDILVNNAGGFGPPIAITDMTGEAWDRMLNLNLKGVFMCCKAIIPHMIDNKYGKIINMSSLSAIAPGPPQTNYSAAKAGVLALTFDLAVQYAEYGINVNAILPGIIRTDLWHANLPPEADRDEYFKGLATGNIPMGRAGTPDDVAGVALFFASGLSDYVTAEQIVVGGGLPHHPPPQV